MAKTIRAFIQSERFWSSDAARLSPSPGVSLSANLTARLMAEAEACRQAAETARLWGLPVGVVTLVEERPSWA